MSVDINKRTLTVSWGGPDSYTDGEPLVALTGGRVPLREVGDLRGHDVVVLTVSELHEMLAAERRDAEDEAYHNLAFSE